MRTDEAMGLLCLFGGMAVLGCLVVGTVDAIRRAVRRRGESRYERRQCARCGYDIRFNVHRCPECGDDLFEQAKRYWSGRLG